VGTGEQVALGVQRVTGAVKAFDEKHFAPGVGFKKYLGHLQAQLGRHVHDDVFPGGQVRGIATVLQLGQPELAVVLHGKFGALATGAGGGIVQQVAYGPAGGCGFFQLLNVRPQFCQGVGLPGEFAGDVVAHLDAAHAVWGAPLQQFQRGQGAVMLRMQAVGAVASGHGIGHHAGQAAVFQHRNARGFAGKPELDGVQRTGVGRVHVGLLVKQPALAGIDLQLRGQHRG
jgi:hypothetical protein